MRLTHPLSLRGRGWPSPRGRVRVSSLDDLAFPMFAMETPSPRPSPSEGEGVSRQHTLDHMPMHIGEPALDAVVVITQLRVVETQ